METEPRIPEDSAEGHLEVPWAGVAERFALGRTFGEVRMSMEPSSGPDSWPFGLRYAKPVSPTTCAPLDISQIGYCPRRQMSTLGDAVWIQAATSRDLYCPETTIHDNQSFTDQVVDRSERD
jgi:hypothetical protein